MILHFLLQVMLVLSSPTKPMAEAQSLPAIAKPNCPSSCGHVTIPYPFGIGPGCYFDDWFAVDCRFGKPFLKSINIELLGIFLQQNSIRVNQPVVRSCPSPYETYQAVESLVNLENSPFYFSYQFNIFIGVGCDNFASMFSAHTRLGFCISTCSQEYNTINKPGNYECNGIKCCQSGVPRYLKSLNISVSNKNNGTIDETIPEDCTYAFLVEKGWFHKNFKSAKYLHYWQQVPVVLDWGIFNTSLGKLARNESPGPSGSTSNSTNCSADENGLVTCHCLQGYHGNPYLFEECQDINECETGNICSPYLVCENYPGNYTCVIPESPKLFKMLAGTGGGLVGLILLGVVAWMCITIGKIIKWKEENFKRNGGLLLQKLLDAYDGSVDRCKIFSSVELERATDHFSVNRVLGQGGQGTVYKGKLADGRIVAVKKSKVVDEAKLEPFINEIVILSQINHRNVVKLLGCCLEGEVPLLVYEFISNGNLSQYLHNRNEELPLTWDVRLRIATEVAEALSYLHSAAYLPIYHRDIKPTNILLDENYSAKVADFGTSRSTDIDQTHVSTKIHGTFGYLDPEYFYSSQFTDKSDVYSFGVVLVELLTGKRPTSLIWTDEGGNLATLFASSMEKNRLDEILDAQILRTIGNRKEIIAVAEIAKRCLNPKGKARPKMKEVAMELEMIRTSSRHNNSMEQNFEDDDLASIESIESWDVPSTSTTSPH